MFIASIVVLSQIAAALLLSWGYFRRYAVTRPPIGVFNLWDIAIMIGGIILVPYLYLILPIWLVAGLLALAILSVLYVVWEPILQARWAIWFVTLALVATDVGTALLLGTATTPFFAVNNIVLILAIVSITNLWAQSGMKARDVALLAGMLAIYDVIVTWQLAQTADLFSRLLSLPLAPIIAWPVGDQGQWLGIGMGDMLLATVFPLVMRKAFGRRAGIAALAINLGSIVSLLLFATLGGIRDMFPVMVVLGPLMLAQYVYWRQQRGPEQAMWQYLQTEPR
ncbi:MAG TPA: hypothetical protein VGJ87_19210 [Roseiflexaceae bacterium]